MSRGNKWSKEEMDFMAESWGSVSIPAIAKHLGRTVEAVKIKAVRTGLGRHIHSGSLITLSQFCEAIGKKNSYSWISDRWIREGLPICYKKSNSKRFKMIDIEQFWKWARDHKHLIDFIAFEKYSLGAEPEWVEKARKAALLAQAKKTPWTPSEDQKLIDLLRQYRYTYNDLCTMLGRTEGAIKRRILTLNLRERPIRNYDKHWTDEEAETLLQLRAEGHCWDEIGRRLSRSGSATRGKYERLQNPEYCKRYYRRMEDKQWVSIRDITPEQIMEGRKGGIRSMGTIKSCFSENTDKKDYAEYRPLWFWSDKDKLEYKEWRNLKYSDCYEVWGFTRTGCVGCPFNSKAEQELAIAQKYEPQKVKAAYAIFGKSYEYKRKYIEFKENMKQEAKHDPQQIQINF